jgi:hypothetical protein
MESNGNGSVRIEILAREDCPNRGMAMNVVERAVDETGVPADIELIVVSSEDEAESWRLLGSPTVLVDGRDVDPSPNGHAEFTLEDRVYRTERGLAGWPDPHWVKEALLRAVAQTTRNGAH